MAGAFERITSAGRRSALVLMTAAPRIRDVVKSLRYFEDEKEDRACDQNVDRNGR
jgi:hypothetical protein